MIITTLLLAVSLQAPPAKNPIRPPVLSAAVDQSTKRIFAGLSDRLSVIDIPSGDVLQTIAMVDGPATAMAFDPVGSILAAATGKTGESGVIKVFKINNSGFLEGTASLSGPKDLIMNLAFSSDGKTLAAVGYDRMVYLWNFTPGKNPAAKPPLKDHSDWVRALAFSPDGKTLATGGADRSVKIWDTATGKLKDSFNDANDAVHCILWTADGSSVISGGGDRSLRQRPVASTDVTPVQTLFGHTKAIIGALRANSKNTFVTLGEDSVLKLFRHSPLQLINTSQSVPAPVTSVHLVGTDKAAITARDGNIYLVQLDTGKILQSIAADKPVIKTVVNAITPAHVVRGSSTLLKLKGTGLASLTLNSNQPAGLSLKLAPYSGGDTRDLICQSDATMVPGRFNISFSSANSSSIIQGIEVMLSDPVEEAKANSKEITKPVTVLGDLSRAGEVDSFLLTIPAGESWGLMVLPAPPAKWSAELDLVEKNGTVIKTATNLMILPVSSKPFRCRLLLHDNEFSGGTEKKYSLHIGPIPMIENLVPRALVTGKETLVVPKGIHLPAGPIKITPLPSPTGTLVDLPRPWSAIPGAPKLIVSNVPVSTKKEPILSYPALVQSDLAEKTDEDIWEFSAKKGEPLWIETLGQRIGSTVDTTLRITSRNGADLVRRRLAPSSQTVVVLRDHDSVVPGIRIENWKDFAVNDYLYAGGELMRIKTLPRNPDDDCQFHARSGRRVGWEGTTPVQHPIGQTILKVSLNEPGTNIPAGPLAVVDLPYISDDGRGTMGRDSGLVFIPPADGIFQARIKDSRGYSAGPAPYLLAFGYHQPTFSLNSPVGMVEHVDGGAGELNLEVERTQEHSGQLQVTIDSMPKGWKAGSALIAEGETSTTLLLQQEKGAGELQADWKIKITDPVTGKSQIASGVAGKTVLPVQVVAKPGLIQLAVKPGGIVRLPISIERSGDFKGRVPVEVRGLPPGVRVLDIGLNGILIPPDQTARTLQIEVDPWFKPSEVSFNLVAKQEGKGQTASQMVTLSVADKEQPTLPNN